MVLSVILFFCLLSLASCSDLDEVLVGVRNENGGVTVSLSFPRGEEDTTMPLPMREIAIPDHLLSPECGQNYIRCQDVLTKSVNLRQKVIFVPLRNALGLVSVRVVKDIPLHLEMSYTTLPTPSCSPSAVVKMLENYFAVCTNSSSNLVNVYDVRLNAASLDKSSLSRAIHRTVPPDIGSIARASNYLHIGLDPNHEYVVFAFDTNFVSLRPFDYSLEILSEVPSEYCEAVNMLAPLNGPQFYAYCTEYLYMYDIGEENWLYRYTFTERGMPYQCPQGQTNVSVFDSYIHLEFSDSSKNVDITGDAYGSGVCFGNVSQAFFAFADTSDGVSVLNLTDAEWISVSTAGCQAACYPLIAVDNRYLIARDSTGTRVFDFFGDQMELITAAHSVPPLVTLLTFGPFFTSESETSVGPPIMELRDRVLAGSIIGGLLVIVATLVITAIIVCVVYKRIHPEPSTGPKVMMSIEATNDANRKQKFNTESNPQSHVHAQNREETVTGHHAPSRPAVIVTADIQKQEEASSRIEPESDSCSTAADDTPILHHSEA